MYSCINIPLKKDGKGSYPTDNSVQTALRSLGIEISPDSGFDDDEASEKITIKNSEGQEIEVNRWSTRYYRESAKKNVETDAPPDIAGEIKRYCIFTGGSSSHQANIFANRVIRKEVNLVVFQASLENSVSCLQMLLSGMSDKKCRVVFDIDSLSRINRPLTLRSGKGGAEISRGDVGQSRFSLLWKHKKIETITLGILLAVFLVSYGIASVDVTTVTNAAGHSTSEDPLYPGVRKFADNLWPSAAVGALTLLLTLIISFFAFPSNKISWAWSR